MSRILVIAAAAALLSLSACNKTSEEAPAPSPAQQTSMAPEPAAAPDEEPAMDGAMTAKPVEEAPAAPAMAPAPVAKPAEAPAAKPVAKAEAPAAKPAAPTGKVATLTQDEALALAGKGNCLACHKIDSKVVGPAWKDVAAKYKGDAKAASKIAANIKAGGSFGWKFGVMPPRGGSKLSDADVESLAKFIASLK